LRNTAASVTLANTAAADSSVGVVVIAGATTGTDNTIP
jgi:hypothetical protein